MHLCNSKTLNSIQIGFFEDRFCWVLLAALKTQIIYIHLNYTHNTTSKKNFGKESETIITCAVFLSFFLYRIIITYKYCLAFIFINSQTNLMRIEDWQVPIYIYLYMCSIHNSQISNDDFRHWQRMCGWSPLSLCMCQWLGLLIQLQRLASS